MATWVGYPAAYTKGRNRPVQYVVIHATEGGEGPTAAEDGAHYDKIRTDGTSTHVFVDQNTALREVPDADRANAARYHGNEIGLQVELCGVAAQTWAQWHDGASTSELRLAAKEVAQMCADHGIPPVHLSVAQVRAAYYAPVGQRPKGICAHNDVTGAYPEDAGTHTDPGPQFPWAEFLAMVAANLAGGPAATAVTAPIEEDDMKVAILVAKSQTCYLWWLADDGGPQYMVIDRVTVLDQLKAACGNPPTVGGVDDADIAAGRWGTKWDGSRPTPGGPGSK